MPQAAPKSLSRPDSSLLCSNSDLTTFNVLPALQDQAIIAQWGAVNDSLVGQIKGIVAQLPSDPNATLTPAQTALQQQGNSASVTETISTQRMLTANFAYVSDRMAETLSNYLVTKAYADGPRLIATSSSFRPMARRGGNASVRLRPGERRSAGIAAARE